MAYPSKITTLEVGMEFLNLMLYVGLIILMNINNDFVVYGRELLDSRLAENGVIPQHYEVMLNLETNTYTATARVVIEVNILKKTRTIYLHATHISIIDCHITNIDTGHIVLKEDVFEQATLQELTLRLQIYVNPGRYILHINYVVNLNDIKGVLKIKNDTNDSDKYTQLLIFNAGLNSTRGIFPCWDEPAFKATFIISVKHPKKYKIFSSMPGSSMPGSSMPGSTFTQEKGIDKIITIFAITPVIPTYLVGIMIIDFKLVHEMHINFTMWYKPLFKTGIKYALNVTTNVMKILEPLHLHQNRTVLKTDIIVLPGQFDVIQKWGLVVYSEKSVEYYVKLDFSNRKVKVAAIVAREIAQQLIGNTVSPSSLIYNWLTEGLSSFFQLYALAQIFEKFPRDTFIIYHERFVCNYGIHFPNRTFTYGNYAKNITLSTATLYSRVTFVLRMLQHIMTEELFLIGIKTYLNKESAESEDLWTIFQQIAEANNISWSSAYKLKDAIDGCLMQTDYPVLIVITNYITGCVLTYLRTSHEDNGNNFNWTVPIIYTLESDINFASTVPFYFLESKNQIYINLNSSNWIIFNLLRVGCYRVYYDTYLWEKIAYYLNYDKYTNIHVLNRAQIIDDAYYFMVKREISFSLFLNIINYLRRETDYTVWYSMEPVVEYIWDLCKNSQLNKIKEFMSEIWDKLLTDMHYYDKHTDTEFTKMKRMFARRWACQFGHTVCRTVTASQMESYLDTLNSEISHINASMHWMFCTGMIAADKKAFHIMMNKNAYIGEDFLEYLACSEDEKIIIYYLHILIQNISLKNGRRVKAYNIIVKKHAEKNNVLQYILDHFEDFKLINKLSTMDAIALIINNVYAGRNLYTIKEYLNGHIYLYRTIIDEAEDLIDARLDQVTKGIAYFSL